MTPALVPTSPPTLAEFLDAGCDLAVEGRPRTQPTRPAPVPSARPQADDDDNPDPGTRG